VIEVQDNWEVLAKSNIQQCRKCGQCSGQGGQCAAKYSDRPLTPGQQAIVDSFGPGPTLQELTNRDRRR
jgi:hypothetical protein